MLYEAEFWVGVAFVIFMGIVWKVGGFKTMIGGIDARSEKIRKELQEAKSLREEAAKLLAEYQAKRQSAEKEAEAIIAQAQVEAERFAKEAEEKMADFIQRRTAQAEQKIAQAEVQAAADVRAAAADTAVRASEAILRAQTTGKSAESLILSGLDEVKARLN